MSNIQITRRAWFNHGTLFLAGTALSADRLLADEPTSNLRVGLVTDLHYADKGPTGTRYYRETLGKLDEAAKRFQEDRPTFLVELGDLIDAADSVDLEQSYLKTINREFAALCGDRHYVLGNHCVDTLTKQEFLGGVEQASSYYSFERGGVHFVVLDACFTSSGKPYGRKNSQWTDSNIPTSELEWLSADLSTTDKPVIVFAHQRLDETKNHSVKNCAEVRKVLESNGKVVAVFQGHSHQNDLSEIAGIHYCTLRAMVEGTGSENNGYSIMDIEPDGSIRLTGFRTQKSYDWDHAPNR